MTIQDALWLLMYAFICDLMNTQLMKHTLHYIDLDISTEHDRADVVSLH